MNPSTRGSGDRTPDGTTDGATGGVKSAGVGPDTAGAGAAVRAAGGDVEDVRDSMTVGGRPETLGRAVAAAGALAGGVEAGRAAGADDAVGAVEYAGGGAATTGGAGAVGWAGGGVVPRGGGGAGVRDSMIVGGGTVACGVALTIAVAGVAEAVVGGREEEAAGVADDGLGATGGGGGGGIRDSTTTVAGRSITLSGVGTITAGCADTTVVATEAAASSIAVGSGLAASAFGDSGVVVPGFVGAAFAGSGAPRTFVSGVPGSARSVVRPRRAFSRFSSRMIRASCASTSAWVGNFASLFC